MSKRVFTYLSYDPDIKVCASKGWKVKVWTWKKEQTVFINWNPWGLILCLWHTLSVCFRRVVAGLPWERSHKMTVSSADPLANTFLGSTRSHVVKKKYRGLHWRKHWHDLAKYKYKWSRKWRHTDRTSLFQDKSRTASVCPSTGSAAAAAPWPQRQQWHCLLKMLKGAITIPE